MRALWWRKWFITKVGAGAVSGVTAGWRAFATDVAVTYDMKLPTDFTKITVNCWKKSQRLKFVLRAKNEYYFLLCMYILATIYRLYSPSSPYSRKQNKKASLVESITL